MSWVDKIIRHILMTIIWTLLLKNQFRNYRSQRTLSIYHFFFCIEFSVYLHSRELSSFKVSSKTYFRRHSVSFPESQPCFLHMGRWNTNRFQLSLVRTLNNFILPDSCFISVLPIIPLGQILFQLLEKSCVVLPFIILHSFFDLFLLLFFIHCI